MEILRSRGTRLGEESIFEPSAYVTVPFSKSDLLFLYSDGLLENTNLKGEEFGKGRAKEAIFNSKSTKAERVAEELRKQSIDFTRDCPPADDVTFVMFSRNV
jgi:serine phosphatase RsbU (regulator of sigma subunit)